MVVAGDDEALETAGCSSHAAVNFAVGIRADTGRAPHKLLRTFDGRHAEGFNRLTFLAVDGDGLVSILHSLFYTAGR